MFDAKYSHCMNRMNMYLYVIVFKVVFVYACLLESVFAAVLVYMNSYE